MPKVGRGVSLCQLKVRFLSNKHPCCKSDGNNGDESMDVVRTDDEIARVENWAVDVEGSGEVSNYPGMTYEQGVMDTIAWLRGDSDTAPDE